MLPDLPDDVLQFLPLIPRLGIAVSGGGDSVALLIATQKACEMSGIQLLAATVDHGLRAAAAGECLFVSEICQNLKVHHSILNWDGLTAQGNVQGAARDARYRLLSEWAVAHEITHVLLGHTADDQAETMLMAIGRGAGAEGLAGMQRSVLKGGVTYLRPWLHVSRKALRDGLKEIDQTWIDDPSNDDDTFQRVKLRGLLLPLADAGVPLASFGQVAKNMAQVAGEWQDRTANLKAEHVIAESGDYLIRQDIWKRLGFEPARRLVLAILAGINSGAASPRRAEQLEILRRLRQNQNATIAGCRVSTGWGMVRFAREHRAVADEKTATDQIWDGRWRLNGPHAADLHIAALGERLKNCPQWRKSALPEPSLRASPAIWRGDHLIAAPLAGFSKDWHAQIVAETPTSATGH